MIISGTYFKEKRFWVVDLPVIDASTQALRKEELPAMIADLFSSLLDRKITLTVELQKDGQLLIETSDDDYIFPLILKRQRGISGISQKDAAKTLGYSSVNAYSAYEQGQRRPSLEKASKLLRAVGGKRRLRIRVG